MKFEFEVIPIFFVMVLAVAYAILMGTIVYALSWIDYPIRRSFFAYMGYPRPPKPEFPPQCARIL